MILGFYYHCAKEQNLFLKPEQKPESDHTEQNSKNYGL